MRSILLGIVILVATTHSWGISHVGGGGKLVLASERLIIPTTQDFDKSEILPAGTIELLQTDRLVTSGGIGRIQIDSFLRQYPELKNLSRADLKRQFLSNGWEAIRETQNFDVLWSETKTTYAAVVISTAGRGALLIGSKTPLTRNSLREISDGLNFLE